MNKNLTLENDDGHLPPEVSEERKRAISEFIPVNHGFLFNEKLKDIKHFYAVFQQIKNIDFES